MFVRLSLQHQALTRCFCSVAQKPRITSLNIVRSRSNNPLLNLAYEETMLHKFDTNSRTLLLWQNEPTIVLGRNQNVWKEVNLPQARESGVHIIRRESGGGCVYHDAGNVNFTFFTPTHQPFDNLHIIQRALKSIGVEVETSKRHELLLNDKKISGSAFRLLGQYKQCYHHCTLLINSDLSFLDSVLLSATEKAISSKATNSVRSVVTNINETHPFVGKEDIFSALSTHFVLTYQDGEDVKFSYSEVTEEDLQQNEEVQEVVSKFDSWEWTYGQSPKFTTTISNNFSWGEMTIAIHCTKGIVTLCEVSTSHQDESLEQSVAQIFEGKKYSKSSILEIREHAPVHISDKQWTEIWDWLLGYV
eukprot:TRINITY_DN14468_c0_g1_i1.p1 TRINITY_DN14468_c0_g1~~TRINITY_DN14468_c0_g1_i1.p1  ORF type:complete len:361 (+),score=44.96 TRINITY_DN14468_c0_g1_i1:2-1084(+)